MHRQYLDLKTPCYILDENKLIANYTHLEQALSKRWHNYCIGYSFKTNSLPWVITKLKELGAYAEVVSETEYKLALKMGYNSSAIIFNGPCKGFKSIEEVLEADGVVNLDSFHEIDWLKNNKPSNKKFWKVGLRINFDLEKECPGETIMGKDTGRFGFNIESGAFYQALNALSNLPYVRVVGIHGHHSTKTKSLNVFKAIARKIVEVTQGIQENIEYIDMGGCFFGDKSDAPSFNDYVEAITNELANVFDTQKVSMILEPGAALIASPFKYLCRAIDKKDIKNTRYVGIDGSLIHIAPQLNNSGMFPEIYATGNKTLKNQVLSGFTCIEKDRILMEGDNKELNVGDYILFNNVGAYSMALSPLFIQYYPRVYVEKENEILLAREVWQVEDYIKNCFW